MKYFSLILFLFSSLVYAQFDMVMDPRTGRAAAYAGTFLRTPIIQVPKNPRFPAKNFRGVWVATIRNIDMPACAFPPRFKAQFIRILDNLKKINATAILFQVRPLNDAFYPSQLNPYSRYMTGTEGRGYSGFDPMRFMIDESHRRGIEFHAWLNPYRVSLEVPSRVSFIKTLSNGNFAKKNPELVLAVPVSKGKVRLFLDPGNPKTRSFFTATVREIIQKYNVDGIHLDDYFYPYEPTGNADSRTWKQYNPRRLSLADWRRENVNEMVRNISALIRNHNKAHGRHVVFGISPFGIWLNKKSSPQGSLTNGSESYKIQYADTRLWVKKHWVDYIAPQLYWGFGNERAAYAALTDWWVSVVRGTGVSLYPGLSQARSGVGAEWGSSWEIYNQMRYNLRHPEIKGMILFSYKRIFFPENKVMMESSKKIINAWRSAK